MEEVGVTTWIGAGLLARPLKVRRSDTAPSGALEGIKALICPGVTTKGMTSTDTLPWNAWIETPPSVVPSGNASGGLVAGPSDFPKIEKTEPRAMPPFGRPGAAKLAALTTPRLKMNGVWPSKSPGNPNRRRHFNIG